ncbi:hypothetical protein [Spiroplasma endosymbiont of Labia minor]|uniref:hypothetical protein n=1 Tax=Spiroplasma endosymbiont of Labia minor TaxID=3066305 RepID=UPI0030CD46A2
MSKMCYSQAAVDNRYVLSDTTSETANSLFGNVSETNSQLDPTNTGVYKDTGYVKKWLQIFMILLNLISLNS